jgi:hypothetical protein
MCGLPFNPIAGKRWKTAAAGWWTLRSRSILAVDRDSPVGGRVDGCRDVNSTSHPPGRDHGASVLTKCSQVPVAGLANYGSCRSGRIGAIAHQAQLGSGNRCGQVIRRREESSGPQGGESRYSVCAPNSAGQSAENPPGLRLAGALSDGLPHASWVLAISRASTSK